MSSAKELREMIKAKNLEVEQSLNEAADKLIQTCVYELEKCLKEVGYFYNEKTNY